LLAPKNKQSPMKPTSQNRQPSHLSADLSSARPRPHHQPPAGTIGRSRSHSFQRYSKVFKDKNEGSRPPPAGCFSPGEKERRHKLRHGLSRFVPDCPGLFSTRMSHRSRILHPRRASNNPPIH